MNGDNILLFVEDPIAEAAQQIGAALKTALAAHPGQVGLLLSGGRTPKAMLQHLLLRELDWSRIEVAASDERLVPRDDPASTEGMIRAAFAASGRPLTYRGFGACSTPERALKTWREQLAAMPWPPAVAFLGMGEDAHVASLFPGRPEVADPELFAAAVPNTPPHVAARLTLGRKALSACPVILMVVIGAEKQAVLARALALAADPVSLPVAFVTALPQTTILMPSNPQEHLVGGNPRP